MEDTAGDLHLAKAAAGDLNLDDFNFDAFLDDVAINPALLPTFGVSALPPPLRYPPPSLLEPSSVPAASGRGGRAPLASRQIYALDGTIIPLPVDVTDTEAREMVGRRLTPEERQEQDRATTVAFQKRLLHNPAGDHNLIIFSHPPPGTEPLAPQVRRIPELVYLRRAPVDAPPAPANAPRVPQMRRAPIREDFVYEGQKKHTREEIRAEKEVREVNEASTKTGKKRKAGLENVAPAASSKNIISSSRGEGITVMVGTEGGSGAGTPSPGNPTTAAIRTGMWTLSSRVILTEPSKGVHPFSLTERDALPAQIYLRSLDIHQNHTGSAASSNILCRAGCTATCPFVHRPVQEVTPPHARDPD
ncbi:hypothetical protein FB451DRAFT_1167672 [Mycena latifolia]|nr:hypothetical protein FB451DRAFT_1167672 [Mycena latifolia]